MTGERIARMILEERSTTAALPATSSVVRSLHLAKMSAMTPGRRP
jgi:hypothetical protein